MRAFRRFCDSRHSQNQTSNRLRNYYCYVTPWNVIWKNLTYSSSFTWLSPPCNVASMTAGLPSPHRLVRLLARALSQVLVKSRWHASFHRVFGRPLFVFPGISVISTFLSRRSSSLLITCPSRFNRLFAILLFIVCVRSRICIYVSLRTSTVASSSGSSQSPFLVS